MMKTWAQFLVEREQSYSCVMAILPESISKKLIDWGKKNISDEDLTADGREHESHVTILYGLHTNDLKEVKDCLGKVEPIKIKLGKVTMFTNNPDFNVVKISVESPNLVRLNKRLKKLDYTTKYPDYKPHATIAYVKKGKRYDGEFNDEFEVDRIKFSTHDGKRHYFDL